MYTHRKDQVQAFKWKQSLGGSQHEERKCGLPQPKKNKKKRKKEKAPKPGHLNYLVLLKLHGARVHWLLMSGFLAGGQVLALAVPRTWIIFLPEFVDEIVGMEWVWVMFGSKPQNVSCAAAAREAIQKQFRLLSYTCPSPGWGKPPWKMAQSDLTGSPVLVWHCYNQHFDSIVILLWCVCATYGHRWALQGAFGCHSLFCSSFQTMSRVIQAP